MTGSDPLVASLAEGKASRSASLRHRRLLDAPMAVVLWQLDQNPGIPAAIGWGRLADRLTMAVAGDPRSRDLALDLLGRFAQWFVPQFEGPAGKVDLDDRQDVPETPQIIVPNGDSVAMLGRVGRFLASLPLEGPQAVDPMMIRLGRHLQFLHRRAGYPGQQIIVAMTDLVVSHWNIPDESSPLAVLNAWIDPPEGIPARDAAMRAQGEVVGPVPAVEDDPTVQALVGRFNELRDGCTAVASIHELMDPIKAYYRPLVERTWRLMWTCRDREARIDEAPSVSRRFLEDCRAYKSHMEWMAGGARRRPTADQEAASTQRAERARQMLIAEEACEDPLRMAPYLQAHKAVEGRVVSLDLSNEEVALKRRVRRPLLVLESPAECRIPPGQKLYWTDQPKVEWVLEDVQPAPPGSLVSLKLNASGVRVLPVPDTDACFSVLTTSLYTGPGIGPRGA